MTEPQEKANMAIRNSKKAGQVLRSFIPVHCPPTTTSQLPVIPAPEITREHVAVAAYFLAEKQAFSGDPRHYWIEAEKQMVCKAS
jgi:hypothetical protein